MSPACPRRRFRLARITVKVCLTRLCPRAITLPRPVLARRRRCAAPSQGAGRALALALPHRRGRVDADQAARAAAGLLCRRRGEAPQYAASAGDLGRAGKACGLGRRAVSSIFWGAAPFILWGAGESLAGGGRPCAARPPSRLCRPSGS